MINFDEELELYTTDIAGVIFTWEEEPPKDAEEQAAAAAANYRERLPEIIAFMLPSLRQMYGEVTAEEAARKIGRPSIDLDAGQVSYCEQRFDDMHIFSFEFSGDDFQELDYLSIDG